MAVARLSCPECGTTLRPAKPLATGKKVKCPECAFTFTVVDDKPAAPAAGAVATKPGKSSARAKPAAPSPAAAKKPEPPPPAPTPAAAPRATDDDDEDSGPATYGMVEDEKPVVEEEDDEDEDDEDEDEDEDDDDDEDGGRKKKKAKATDITYGTNDSIKDLRGPASEALIRPMNKLIFLGSMGFLGWFLLLIVLLFPIMFPMVDAPAAAGAAPGIPVKSINAGLGSATQAKMVPPKREKVDPERPYLLLFGMNLALIAAYQWFIIFLLLLPCPIGMIHGALVAYGAVQAQSLQSHPWGMVSTILALVPINLGGVIALFIMICVIVSSMILDDSDIYINIGIPVTLCAAQIAFGIVGLTTLMRPEVIEGFHYEGD